MTNHVSRSLHLFLGAREASMLPSHGGVTQRVRTLAETLLEHHRDRRDLVHELGGYTA
jgi:hypothetical protein